MEKKSRNNTRPREGRSDASRLTINIPKGTLTALKIHVAQRETTIREIVTDLIEKEIGKTPIWPKLWLVAEGDVTEADETTESDGVNNVLAYTCTEEQALELARLYDAGKLELGNVTLRHDGNVVAALRASEAA